MHAELIEDALRVGKHVHQVRDRRALVAADVGDPGLQQRLGDGKNALASKFLARAQPQRLDFLANERSATDVLAGPRQAGTSASTRSGLPEPFTIFSGGAMTMAPVGGNFRGW